MAAKKRIIYPIQLDPELDAKIALAADHLSLPKAEVMRLAMAIGLEHLERINFNLAKHLCQTNPLNPLEYQSITPLASVAETKSSPSTPAAGAQPVKYPRAQRRKNQG